VNETKTPRIFFFLLEKQDELAKSMIKDLKAIYKILEG